MESYTIQEYFDFQEKVKHYLNSQDQWILPKMHVLGVQILWRRIYFSNTGETIFYNDNYQLWKQLPWLIETLGVK